MREWRNERIWNICINSPHYKTSISFAIIQLQIYHGGWNFQKYFSVDKNKPRRAGYCVHCKRVSGGNLIITNFTSGDSC